jgi:uncharacterized membrane protein YkoI
MQRRVLVMTFAMVGVVGLTYAGAQTSNPAQKQAAPTAKALAAAKDSEADKLLKDLPPAVKATVVAETKNATLKGLSKEKEKGKTVYELESLVNGRTRDLMIDSAGKVYLVEEQLDPNSAPAPVRAALEAKGTIVVLESVLQNGTTTYEGQVKTKAGKKLSMELNADGTPLKK